MGKHHISPDDDLYDSLPVRHDYVAIVPKDRDKRTNEFYSCEYDDHQIMIRPERCTPFRNESCHTVIRVFAS